MTEFTSHQPGTVSWVELATTDQTAAVAFYRALFDWELNEQPIGPTEVYSMFQLRGQEVGAAYTMREDERKMGVPPHWNLYVTVADVEESARRAQELGGTLLAPPFDVMDAGRMAVVQDPTGAIVQLWEAKRSIGAKILGEPGALCWSELTTWDPDAARAFYTALFGWTARESGPGSPMPYTEFSNNGQAGMGMLRMPDGMSPDIPSYWMPYFQVANCDEATAKASKLGAEILVPAQDIPQTGRFSILTDPQGARFAVFTYVS